MSSVCSAVQTIKSGNGSQTQFSFDFPYVFKTEIHVYFWNVTTKEYDEILTTDSTYPWQVPSTNPTIVEFTGTAPPAPSDATANIKIRRITNIDDIQALFNPGSAIRSDDLNSNFEQLRFAVQESLCPDITEAEVVTYLQNYYWNNFEDTVTSTATWTSSDTKIATTAAMDARFQDELAETITSTETWANDDNTIATTAAIDDQIDNAITNDILIDSTGLTKSSSGGQTTLGIGAGAVDLDRIKSDDIVATSAYSSTWTSEDDKIVTAGALAARHDVVVNTDVNPPSTAQVGKQWLSTAPGNQVHKIYDGSGWRTVAVGQPYSPATTTVVRYVDVTNGSDASDVTGFLPQAPLQSIGRALDLINASSSGDGSLIKVAPGVYQETLPLRIKKNNVSIVGESMRSCFVHPTVVTENNDMFEVDSGTYIANLTLLGLKVPTSDQSSRNNSLDNDATYGLPSNQPFSVRFRTDTQPTILKSPYIQNCTHFSDAHFDNANFDPNTFPSTDSQTYSAVAGDESSAPCGGGLLVDGSAVSSSSPIRSMVVDAFTQITLDGPGILVTNNGYAQLVSFFGTFAHYHAKAKNGGQINLSNCVSDFGRYGLIADGKSPSAIATATASAANSGATTITIGAITTAGSFHGTVSRPLDHMMVTIDGVDYGVVSSTANGSGWDIVLTSGLTSNITNTTVSFALRSYISTGGHTFEFVGVGTDYGDHPDNGGVPIEANQVIELNGGKVWQSSTDHVGKFKAGDVLVVDQVSETVDLKDTTVTGNITVTGTVDGRDVATDGTKLDGIESGATGDQTAAEIRTLVESASDSNVFTDADHSKLNAIEANATADQTASEIKTAYESNSNTNAFTDAEKTKLSGIATGAEVNVNADWNATSGDAQILNKPTLYSDSSVDSHLNQSSASANEVLGWNGSDYAWVAQTAGYSNSSVDAHLNQSTAATNEILSWNGSDYDWVAQAVGVSDGDKGDITVSNSGATFTIDNGVVSTAKIADDAVTADKLANTAVTAGSYGSATAIPAITVDAQGRITAASTNSFSAGATDIDGLSDAVTYNSGQSIGIGANALDSEDGGEFRKNTAVGYDALTAVTTGQYNVALGYQAGKTIATANYNTAVGVWALQNLNPSTVDSANTAVGYFSQSSATTGILNTSVGQKSAYSLTTGSYNVAVGVEALEKNTTASYNTACGYRALEETTDGQSNTSVGYEALTNNTGGDENSAFGVQALMSNTTASNNSAFGQDALRSTTTGGNNTALGKRAGRSSTTGANNTLLGYSAGSSLTTGSSNVFAGWEAANNQTTAQYGVAIGVSAGLNGTANYTVSIGNNAGYHGAKGANNVCIGTSAGYGTSSVSSTGEGVYIGNKAGFRITSTYRNVFLGGEAGSRNTSGNGNIFIGYEASGNATFGTTTGSNVIVIGHEANPSSNTASNEITLGNNSTSSLRIPGLQSGATNGQVLTYNSTNGNITLADAGGGGGVTNNADDTNSIGLGTNALDSETAGQFHTSQNTALGVDAATNVTTGGPNVAIGYRAAYSLATGVDNVAIGWESLYNSTANDNIAVGSRALYSTTTGTELVAVGDRAGTANTTGTSCTFLGFEAGKSNTTGSNSTLIGSRAGQAITTFGEVVAIGQDAASEQSHHNASTFVGRDCGRNTKGNRNTAVGKGAQRGGGSNQCDENVSVGYHTLYTISGGDNNTAVGSEAGKNITTASHLTCIGRNAGLNITTGNNSVCVGKDAGSNITTGLNLIVVGTGAQPSSATATHEITLGNSSITKLRVPGLSFEIDSSGVDLAGNVLLTASNPQIQFNSGGPVVKVPSANTLAFNTDSSTERMRIDNSGRLFIGSTGFTSNNTVRINMSFTGGGSEYGMCMNAGSLNAGTKYITFDISTTNYGSIGWNGSAIQYYTSSDHRLKENIVSLEGGIERVKQLQPRRFNFIHNADMTVDGFVAHEAQVAVPEAISGTHNEVDSNGNPVYQSIDLSKFVPLLTAALKEAIAKIETLETKVAALEAA